MEEPVGNLKRLENQSWMCLIEGVNPKKAPQERNNKKSKGKITMNKKQPKEISGKKIVTKSTTPPVDPCAQSYVKEISNNYKDYQSHLPLDFADLTLNEEISVKYTNAETEFYQCNKCWKFIPCHAAVSHLDHKEACEARMKLREESASNNKSKTKSTNNQIDEDNCFIRESDLNIYSSRFKSKMKKLETEKLKKAERHLSAWDSAETPTPSSSLHDDSQQALKSNYHSKDPSTIPSASEGKHYKNSKGKLTMNKKQPKVTKKSTTAPVDTCAQKYVKTIEMIPPANSSHVDSLHPIESNHHSLWTLPNSHRKHNLRPTAPMMTSNIPRKAITTLSVGTSLIPPAETRPPANSSQVDSQHPSESNHQAVVSSSRISSNPNICIEQIHAHPVNSSTVTLSWDIPAALKRTKQVTGYQVCFRKSGENKWETIKVSQNIVKIMRLLPETKYYFRVQPYTKDQMGIFSQTTGCVTKKKQLGPPRKLNGYPISGTKIFIEWDPPEELSEIVTGYLITYKEVGLPRVHLNVENINHLTIDGLIPDTIYIITIETISENYKPKETHAHKENMPMCTQITIKTHSVSDKIKTSDNTVTDERVESPTTSWDIHKPFYSKDSQYSFQLVPPLKDSTSEDSFWAKFKMKLNQNL